MNRRHFRPRIPPWSRRIRFSPGKFVHLRSQRGTCSCQNHIFAAALQWFAENDETTCVRSTPKCVFLGNGDDSSGARGGLATTRTLKKVAVLGNYAVFRSARALHHRNPRPLQSRFVTNMRISRTALRFCWVILLDLGPTSADGSVEPPRANTPPRICACYAVLLLRTCHCHSNPAGTAQLLGPGGHREAVLDNT